MQLLWGSHHACASSSGPWTPIHGRHGEACSTIASIQTSYSMINALKTTSKMQPSIYVGIIKQGKQPPFRFCMHVNIYRSYKGIFRDVLIIMMYWSVCAAVEPKMSLRGLQCQYKRVASDHDTGKEK